MLTEIFRRPDGFAWVDVIGPSPSELAGLAKTYGLPPLAVQDCLDPEHLPKYEKMEGSHFIILRAFDENSAPDVDCVQDLTRKLAIFTSARFLITIHRKDHPYLNSLREKWAQSDQFDHPSAPALLLYDLLSSVLNSYDKPIDQALLALENIEERIFKPATDHSIIEEGYYLKRKASVFRRMIRLSSDVLIRIAHEALLTPSLAQDLKENIESSYFYADELVDNLHNLLNLHVSLASQRTNEASHRTNEVMRVLTIFSVFFLPLNFIAGIYGMNFQHMPELTWPYGYPMALGIMVLIAIVILVWFRRRRWI